MAHQWTAQQVIEPPLALELIREQFPELCAEKIRFLGVGWDNTAFVINEEIIFRFPRREIALQLLEAEWCALPRVAPHLSQPIPFPKWKGLPTNRFPWPFIGYRMLPGFTACYANLSDEERNALAEPIGEFLKQLHTIPISEMAHCHISRDNRSRVDGNVLIPKIKKNFEELLLLGLLENEKKLREILESLLNFREPLCASIVHGDFYVRHILVDEKHHLVGVIDWGDMHVGDPAIDLSIAHSFLPVSAQERFKEAYGPITEKTWELAKMRALYSCGLLVLFGHHSGDPVIFREGLRGFKMMCE